ncbi:MAG: hypothetical protein Alpg2KO_04800 [Alphaproteobacteria bacterium]
MIRFGRALRKRAATGVGYGLAVGMIAVTALVAVTTTGDNTKSVMCRVANSLTSVTTPGASFSLACLGQTSDATLFAVAELPTLVRGQPISHRILFDYPGIFYQFLDEPPPGLEVNNGVLEGTPTENGDRPFRIRAVDDQGNEVGLINLGIEVEENEDPSISVPSSPVSATAGEAFSMEILATDPNELNAENLTFRPGPYGLPAGFSLETASSPSGQSRAVLRSSNLPMGDLQIMVCVNDYFVEVCDDIYLTIGPGSGPALVFNGEPTPLAMTWSENQTPACVETQVRNAGAGTAIGVKATQMGGADATAFDICSLSSPSIPECGLGIDLETDDACSIGVSFIQAQENEIVEQRLGLDLGIYRQHGAQLIAQGDNTGVAARNISGTVTACTGPETVLVFDTAGTYPISIPSGCGTVTVQLWGAGGGSNSDSRSGYNDGGHGGYVSGVLPTDSVSSMTVVVGGGGARRTGGFNGGGNGGDGGSNYRDAGGGGGATDLRINGSSLSDRVAVAGGGGGGSGPNGGHGGGLTGGHGGNWGNGRRGYGGTQTSGGATGSNPCCYGGGLNGPGPGFGVGGAGRDSSAGGGGGGGGGWYGGGGGAGNNYEGGSGGGGSNYVPDSGWVNDQNCLDGQVDAALNAPQRQAGNNCRGSTGNGAVGGAGLAILTFGG